jgi:hypothetical protein
MTRQVNTLPVTMRQIPTTWNPAYLDVLPMAVPKKDQIATFRRTYSLATISANTGDTVNAFQFSLSQVPNATDFTNLYDQYRILEAIVTFMPYSTATLSSTETSSFPGIMSSWIDYDDANLPANQAEGQQYDSFQRNVSTDPFERIIHPHSAVASYSGAFTSYDNLYGQWHDAASPAVQHYGLKTVITQSTYATSTRIYDVQVTLTIQCKSQH